MSEKAAKWLRLDNSAKIFPMMADKQNQNLFNIFVRLSEDVDKMILQRALEITIKRFPSMNVMLKRGVFWFYFEQHGGKPKVYDADPIVMKKISSSNCGGFCFRISCYKNVIYADFFHAVTDGTGAAEFVKSLLFTYFTLKGYPVDGEQKVLTVGSPVNPREYEDSFLTNYKKKKIKDLTISSLKGKKSYRISGIRFENAGKGVINMYAPAKQFVSVCREHNCTVTEMIGALFMLSVYETKIKPESLPPQDIQLFVPINLRKIFSSVTLRNFSLFSRIGVTATDDMTLQSLTSTIHECLKRDTQKEVLSDKISTTVYAEKFLPMRILPLFMKRLIFKISNPYRTDKSACKSADITRHSYIELSARMFKNKVVYRACQLSAQTAKSRLVFTAGDRNTIFRRWETHSYFITVAVYSACICFIPNILHLCR